MISYYCRLSRIIKIRFGCDYMIEARFPISTAGETSAVAITCPKGGECRRIDAAAGGSSGRTGEEPCDCHH